MNFMMSEEAKEQELIAAANLEKARMEWSAPQRSSMESDWQFDPRAATTPITANDAIRGPSYDWMPDMTKVQRAFNNPTGIKPTEFKVLILPDPVEETTKGGIIVPIAKAESDKYATIQGTIIAVSHLAFSYATDEEWGDAKPKPGDRVIFAKYAGVRHKAKDGQEYLLVNDKDVVAVVE